MVIASPALIISPFTAYVNRRANFGSESAADGIRAWTLRPLPTAKRSSLNSAWDIGFEPGAGVDDQDPRSWGTKSRKMGAVREDLETFPGRGQDAQVSSPGCQGTQDRRWRCSTRPGDGRIRRGLTVSSHHGRPAPLKLGGISKCSSRAPPTTVCFLVNSGGRSRRARKTACSQ